MSDDPKDSFTIIYDEADEIRQLRRIVEEVDTEECVEFVTI